MLVKDWMSKELVTIDEKNSIKDATKLLKYYEIRMLPVIKNKKVIGIVTDRDIKRVSASDISAKPTPNTLQPIDSTKINKFMTKNPITIPFDYTIEEAAETLLVNKISGVPVVDHNENIVGVITQTDLFRTLISLTGYGKKGIQFAVKLVDKPESIMAISDIVQKHGGRLASILTSPDRVSKGYQQALFRVYGIDRPCLKRFFEVIGEISTILYFVDHRENKRKIFESC